MSIVRTSRLLIAAAAVVVVVVSGDAARAAQRGSDAATDDISRFAVAYVEVIPSATSTLAAAFRQYVDRSRAETGFGSIEMLEQIGRPGHVVVIERWHDQAAFDAHAMASSATAFRAALQRVRVSGYDERPYKTLSVAAARGASPGSAIAVVTHVDVSNAADTAALLKRLADASRTEPGCERFDVLQHTMRANHFTVIETWASERAYDAHVAAAHTKQYRDELQPMTGSPLDERVFRIVTRR
jgi:quinol monooxygenase YgiN